MSRAWTIPIRLPLRAPLVTGAGPIRERRGWLVGRADAAGRVGHAEALPLAGFADAPTALTAAHAWAAADLAARGRGAPLHELFAARLGTRPRHRLPLNALLTADAPDAVARQAARAADAGFAALKLKLVAGGDERDRARVAAARQAAPSLSLRLDANGSLDETRALALCRALSRHRHAIEYLEQPVAADDLTALARVRAGSPIPIAADEAAAGVEAAGRVIAHRAADLLVLKPSLLAPDAALELVARARDAGLGVVVTSALDGALGLAAAAQLAAALPEPLPACGLATAELLADDLAAPPTLRDGALELPAGPGLGVAPDPAALARLRTGPDAERAA